MAGSRRDADALLLPAGANWVDQEVVVDEGLISNRKPADLPAFNRAVVGERSKQKHKAALAH